jgi:hypothetical protein
VIYDDTSPPQILFVVEGSNSDASDYFGIAILDAAGGINNGETYSTSAVTGNQAAFEYDLPSPYACSDIYLADPTQSGVSITVTVTSHNLATKTITGTYTGTAKNQAGGTVNVSGTFSGTYP